MELDWEKDCYHKDNIDVLVALPYNRNMQVAHKRNQRDDTQADQTAAASSLWCRNPQVLIQRAQPQPKRWHVGRSDSGCVVSLVPC